MINKKIKIIFIFLLLFLFSCKDNNYQLIYEEKIPSVVEITVYGKNIFGGLSKFSAGSGFVWDNNGNILTNYHLLIDVKDSNSRIIVRTYDNDEFEAELIGKDPYSDLAVIKINKNLPKLDLGDSSIVLPGDDAIAMGSPFGQSFTMTTGIISAIGRTLNGLTYYKIPLVIQTDAAINPGNSGGPLLNSKGEVIGINTQIKSNSESPQNSGVGFAVPINLAKKVVENIKYGLDHEYSYLGIEALNLDYEMRIRADVEENFKGLLITSLEENGPAEQAGIKGNSNIGNYDGDIITKIDNFEVGSFEDLIAYLALNTSPGDIVKIELVRDYKYREVNVTLGARAK